jgi:hypothetical protein
MPLHMLRILIPKSLYIPLSLNLLNVIIQKRESEEGLVKVNKAMCKSGMICADYPEEMKGELEGVLIPKDVPKNE